MRLNVERKIVVTSLWLALNLSLATSVSYADGFYTIIGPDGRPMIVQKQESKQIPKQDSKQENGTIEENEAVSNPVVEQKTVVKNEEEKTNPTFRKQKVEQSVQSSDVKAPEVILDHSEKSNIDKNKTIKKPPVQAVTEQTIKVKKDEQQTVTHSKQMSQPKTNENLAEQKPKVVINQASDQATKAVQVTPSNRQTNVEKKSGHQPIQTYKKSTVSTDDKHFTEIDGVKYVNNEYLEDREFNLDGKKRFYMTPEVGGAGHGRYETIERKKGLSASLLESIRGKSAPEEHKAVVLSASYFRLPKDEVVKNLEQACFTGKKITKAKGLSSKNQELGLWPVAPIKEHFAYEVVKLDGAVQNVLFTSYASSSKVQTYYWPLVVFLDQQGCVIEGVSGFKSEESIDNNTQYAAMEGILRKPEKAVYMFLTPLSSALDMENKQLTNHGQIKLSVIQ